MQRDMEITGNMIRSAKFNEAAMEDPSLLRSLNEIQSRFIAGESPDAVFNAILREFVRFSESRYGLIGEMFMDGGNPPHIETLAACDAAWDAGTEKIPPPSPEAGLS